MLDNLKEAFNLPKGGNLPVRSKGTRWISHKRKALQRVLDHYGTCTITIHVTVIDDRSVRATDRQH